MRSEILKEWVLMVFLLQRVGEALASPILGLLNDVVIVAATLPTGRQPLGCEICNVPAITGAAA